MAEALGTDLLDGAEPAVLAGVLSAVVFEPRRARRIAGPRSAAPAARGRRSRAPGPLQDRLGDKRAAELAGAATPWP